MNRCFLFLAWAGVVGCANIDRRHLMEISISDQEMAVSDRGRLVAIYPVSTSKFGAGGPAGSNTTPLGRHRVARKIGGALPVGAVLKSRRFTGEILPANAAGRDPVVTRILWLDGVERGNRDSFSRFIYIHGTPEERNIGKPTSFGCIRMRSADVVDLYDRVGSGAMVNIFISPLAEKSGGGGLTRRPGRGKDLLTR